MKTMILFSLFLNTSLFASPVDQQLNNYIKDFKLAPLRDSAPISRALFDLGHKLFHEKKLSGNNNIACIDCHHPRVMTHDGLPLSLGEGSIGLQGIGQGRQQHQGRILPRNSPALINLSLDLPNLFWDGRVSRAGDGKWVTPIELPHEIQHNITSTLALQALFPLVDHDEMRGQPGSNAIADAKDEVEAWKLIVEKILAIPTYQDLFAKAFPSQIITIAHIGEALAAFQQKHFHFADTPYDRYLKGDLLAMTDQQKKGMDVFFGKGKCGECHQGENLTNFEFHAVGVPQIGPGKLNGDDWGRYLVTNKKEDLYAFRVPPLRNVALTAPYFHNGSMNTLEEVIEHYDDIEASLRAYSFVNNWNNYLREIIQHNHELDDLRLKTLSSKLTSSLEFTEEEEEDLLIFIKEALTDVRLQP